MARRPEGNIRLAIRLDERDIDAVHGGAGHEADGAVGGQGRISIDAED
jgi:hypothetical protein